MEPLRVGIVGLDTSHGEQFTLRLNDASHPAHVPGARVVAAWPGGSPDLPLSAGRVSGFTSALRDRGVAILSSIAEVCAAVDAVMILSLDGRAHLGQVRQVLATGRPFFLDKPVAATLAEVVAVYREAGDAGVPMFSASATRFWPDVVALAHGDGVPARAVLSRGPAPVLAHHSELFFYGLHTAEALFTVMGTGCRDVARVSTRDVSLVTGWWDDDRVGSLAAMHALPMDSRDYAVTRVDEGRTTTVAGAGDYRGLVAAIVAFFRDARPPVSAGETLEIYAFLEAARVSRLRGGGRVAPREMLAEAGCPDAWLPPAADGTPPAVGGP